MFIKHKVTASIIFDWISGDILLICCKQLFERPQFNKNTFILPFIVTADPEEEDQKE